MSLPFYLSKCFYSPNTILPLQIINNLLNTFNHDDSDSVKTLIAVAKEITPVRNYAHIIFIRVDNIIRNADVHLKMWRHCWLDRLNFNQTCILFFDPDY